MRCAPCAVRVSSHCSHQALRHFGIFWQLNMHAPACRQGLCLACLCSLSQRVCRNNKRSCKSNDYAAFTLPTWMYPLLLSLNQFRDVRAPDWQFPLLIYPTPSWRQKPLRQDQWDVNRTSGRSLGKDSERFQKRCGACGASRRRNSTSIYVGMPRTCERLLASATSLPASLRATLTVLEHWPQSARRAQMCPVSKVVNALLSRDLCDVALSCSTGRECSSRFGCCS